MLGENQKISHEQCEEIRSLSDWDLEMLVSEIHDHGWPIAAMTLEMIVEVNHLQKVAQSKGQGDTNG